MSACDGFRAVGAACASSLSAARRCVAPRRQRAREHRLGDGRQRHAEIERRLHRPAAGPLLLRLVDDRVDQRAAGRVALAQHRGGDLDQIGIEVALLPLLENAGDRRRVETVDASSGDRRPRR